MFSGIGHQADVDIEQIPSAVAKGNFKPVSIPPQCEPACITFDLETTDLSMQFFFKFKSQYPLSS
jgi:hypothetical protein